MDQRGKRMGRDRPPMPRQLSVSACQPAVRHQGFTRCPLRGFTVKISGAVVGAPGDFTCCKGYRRLASPSWVGSIGLAIAVAITYFLAATVEPCSATEPDGVAVFWPAAGIASGILIALGPSARLPVALGVMAATIAANLLGDRNLASTIVFALCNAGEALIIAWLIEHHFGSDFSLDSPRRVLGFFLATAVGTAISGIGGTAGFILFHDSEAPILTTWLNWFASDAIGNRHSCAAGDRACPHPARSAADVGTDGRVIGPCGADPSERDRFRLADRLLVHDLAPCLALALATLAGRPLPAGVRCRRRRSFLLSLSSGQSRSASAV